MNRRMPKMRCRPAGYFMPVDANPAGGAGDQRAVIAFLSQAASYGETGKTVERIETHISIVFLIGNHAYKLKRAVQFSYVDYARVESREKYCRAELALNRRTAPEIYQSVRSITRGSDGGLSFDGAGAVIDWVVQMRRFDEENLLDRLADRNRLTPAMMRDLADRIAAFHDDAAIVASGGGSAGIREAIAGNAFNLIESCPPLDRTEVDRVNAALMAELASLGRLLDERKALGKVRLCHGDLHLRNLCLVDQRPVIFDGIEFNEAFSHIDVLYDLAFLLMDLTHRGLPEHCNLVVNRYLDRTGDIAGLMALPLFMSVRASIRAHVLVAQYRKTALPQDVSNAQSYLALAAQMLVPQPPRLIAIGGRSGSGKSTVAAALAPAFLPAPGARIVRSDAIRKNLFRCPPATRLPASAYTPAITEKVYRELQVQLGETLSSGYTAIADATFLSEAERLEIAEVARRAGVSFTGFWLDGEAPLLRDRLAARRDDISDADALVLQLQEQACVGNIGWHRLDAALAVPDNLAIMRQMALAAD